MPYVYPIVKTQKAEVQVRSPTSCRLHFPIRLRGLADFRLGSIRKGLVTPFLVVEAEEIAQPGHGLPHALIVFQIHLLTHDRPPQPLHKDVVTHTPPTVVADKNSRLLETARKRRPRELLPLISRVRLKTGLCR